MSKTLCLYHIVFATKYRERTIVVEHKRKLYEYIYGILKNHKCYVHRINGMADHVHILVDIHPNIALSDLVKSVKQSSSVWLGKSPLFPSFDRWADGYYAVSIGVDGIEACKQYIIGQEQHHAYHGLDEEIKQISRYNGLSYHSDDMR